MLEVIYPYSQNNNMERETCKGSIVVNYGNFILFLMVDTAYFLDTVGHSLNLNHKIDITNYFSVNLIKLIILTISRYKYFQNPWVVFSN